MFSRLIILVNYLYNLKCTIKSDMEKRTKKLKKTSLKGVPIIIK
jgi:hypothetical protein